MFPARGISKKSMAANSQNHSFDDSLENRGNGEQLYPVPVGPEDSNKKPDFDAFSEQENEPSSSDYLNLLPYSDFCLLQDKSSGKNRALGVEKLQAAIESAKSATVLETNLTSLVEDACMAVCDSHIKVSLAGLQLLEPLIKRTGSSLTPHLPSLVEAMLGKMNSNKYVLKKAVMKVLIHLMHYSRPHDVTTEIAKFGLRHKHSKVREESLNVITAALIRFSRTEFRLKQMAKEIMPTLSDSRPRVRQACMECAAQIASLCDSSDFKEVVSAAIKNGHHTHGLIAPIIKALEYRIVRQIQPQLKEDGLVQYAMPVIGIEISFAQHGPDVDWIRNGELSTSDGNSGLETSSVRKERKLRPHRSASKKLPWEVDEAEKNRTVEEADATNKQLSETTDLGATFTMDKSLQTAKDKSPASKKLFPKERSNSPPTHRPPSGSTSPPLRRPPSSRRQLRPLNETSSSDSSPKETSTIYLKNLQDMVPSRGGPKIPLLGGSRLGTRGRHQSLPNGVVSRDLMTQNGLRKTTGFGKGSPRLSPIGSATTPPAEDALKQQNQHHQQQMQSQAAMPPTAVSKSDEFSESWPRSRVSLRGNNKNGLDSRPSAAMEQITADPLKAVGAVNDTVRMSVLRPPSKPRVRHPITMRQRQEEKKLKISLLQQQQQQQQQQSQDSPQDSPTQTEKEFLMGCANTTQDSYYDMVPEDTTVLDHSLSSSLTSLCRTTDAPKMNENVDYIRKKVASQKAQLMSTASNSPEHGRSAHDETPVGPSRRRRKQEPTITEAIEKRAKSAAKGFNQTFSAGVSLAHVHPSATTWQDMQNLIQLSPVTTTTDVTADKPHKKKKKKKKSADSNKGFGSSDGSDIALGTGESKEVTVAMEVAQNHSRDEKEPQMNSKSNVKERMRPKKLDVGSRLPVLKPGFRRAGSLGPEGQRPTIEQGGTNKLIMEVNGVKSPPPTNPSPVDFSPPAQRKARGACGGRKQRNSEPSFAPSYNQTFTDEGLDNSYVEQRQPRKKRSKYAVSNHQHNSVDNGDHHGSPSGAGGSKSSLPELQPFSNADRGLHEALKQLDDSDWNEKCDGLLGVRRLAMFHTEKLISELHTVTLAVVKEVQNLRSSVARAAIACLGDMFAYTGRYMDPELERVVRVLLQKTGESNVFIREDVERAMTEIVQYATPNKLLHTLITGRSHKNVQVRRTAAQFLGQTIEHYGPAQLLHASRDLVERTLVASLDFIRDAAAEPRYYGRKCLSYFMMEPEFEKFASRTLNLQQWSKMKEAIETLKVKGVGEPPSETVSTTRSRHPTGGTVRGANRARGTGRHRAAAEEVDAKPPRNARRVPQAVQSAAGEGPALPDRLVERLNAGNWEDRLEAINVLERYVDQYPKALGPHMNKVFDGFNPRLTDRNSKVNLRALEAFSNMVPLLGSLLGPLSANVIKALMPNLASKNGTIYRAAITVFDLISECIDPVVLIQPLATHSQHGNARVQPIMIRKLADLTGLINEKQVTRQVLPAMWHLLGGKPPGSNDTKEAIIYLCEALFNYMGQSFVDRAGNQQPQCQRRLNQILTSGTYS